MAEIDILSWRIAVGASHHLRWKGNVTETGRDKMITLGIFRNLLTSQKNPPFQTKCPSEFVLRHPVDGADRPWIQIKTFFG
nr:hypothetical protein [uncultured Gellertiella sp.]